MTGRRSKRTHLLRIEAIEKIMRDTPRYMHGGRLRWGQLAADAGMRRENLMYIIHRGGKKVSTEELHAIATALGVSARLITYTNLPAEDPPMIKPIIDSPEISDDGYVAIMEAVMAMLSQDYKAAYRNKDYGQMRDCLRGFRYWMPEYAESIVKTLKMQVNEETHGQEDA